MPVVRINEDDNKVTKPSVLKVTFLDTPWRRQDSAPDTQRNILDALRDFTSNNIYITLEACYLNTLVTFKVSRTPWERP